MSNANTSRAIIKTRVRVYGFTLVELLVVIGIIAVLVGILLPTLATARRASSRSVCLSNQRQLATACLMYAQENKGYLPTTPSDLNASLTWEIYFDPAVFGSWVNTTPGYNSGWFGLGHLFNRKLIKDPKAFYCPDVEYPLFTYPAGWTTGYAPNYAAVKSIGYYYRGFGQPGTGIDPADVEFSRSLRVGKFRGIKALTIDLVMSSASPGVWPHRKPFGACASYSDGHADFTEVKKSIYDRAIKPTGLGTVDAYVVEFFKALDKKDFTQVSTKFP